MSDMTSELLSQCMAMTQELIKTKQKATINIRVGNKFYFEFSNQEIEAFENRKKLCKIKEEKATIVQEK